MLHHSTNCRWKISSSITGGWEWLSKEVQENNKPILKRNSYNADSWICSYVYYQDWDYNDILRQPNFLKMKHSYPAMMFLKLASHTRAPHSLLLLQGQLVLCKMTRDICPLQHKSLYQHQKSTFYSIYLIYYHNISPFKINKFNRNRCKSNNTNSWQSPSAHILICTAY
jgi:hypothetical protein